MVSYILAENLSRARLSPLFSLPQVPVCHLLSAARLVTSHLCAPAFAACSYRQSTLIYHISAVFGPSASVFTSPEEKNVFIFNKAVHFAKYTSSFPCLTLAHISVLVSIWMWHVFNVQENKVNFSRVVGADKLGYFAVRWQHRQPTLRWM